LLRRILRVGSGLGSDNRLNSGGAGSGFRLCGSILHGLLRWRSGGDRLLWSSTVGGALASRLLSPSACRSLLSGSAVRACISCRVSSSLLCGRLLSSGFFCISLVGSSCLLGSSGLSSHSGGDQLFGSLDSNSLLGRGL
jgi:hypothetical protein